MLPLFVNLKVQNNRHNFGLWIPVFLVWVILLPFLMLLLPFLIIAELVLYMTRFQIRLGAILIAVCGVLSSLRGTDIAVENKSEHSTIHIQIQ
jgi:hypothetical protein